MWYVFDPGSKEGHLFRAPQFICSIFCRLINKRYDYAPTAAGY